MVGKYFFYFRTVNDLTDTVILTITVSLFNIAIFYNNLLALIPKLYQKKLLYFIGHVVSFLAIIGVYYVTKTAHKIYGELDTDAFVALFLNYCSFSIYSFLYWYVLKFQREKQRSLKLQNEKLLAEMKALKAQVSPHFLFNSLNNIYSLCLNNPKGAADMTEKLSEQLRYLIYKGAQEEVVIEEEIKLIENYLAILKIKKQKGTTTFNYPTNGIEAKAYIPPLILITLVENAITHSHVVSNADSFVNIDLSATQKEVSITISNSFSEDFKPAKTEGGIGLKNVQDQLNIKYPGRFTFTQSQTDNIYTTKLTLCPTVK